MPNAFALGRSPKHSTVCATTGIMELLSPAELEGVMAHELTHVANRDVAIMTFASFFASLASMIVQFGFFFGGGAGDDDDGPGFFAVIMAAVVVYAVSFVLMMALSRYREAEAIARGLVSDFPQTFGHRDQLSGMGSDGGPGGWHYRVLQWQSDSDLVDAVEAAQCGVC